MATPATASATAPAYLHPILYRYRTDLVRRHADGRWDLYHAADGAWLRLHRVTSQLLDLLAKTGRVEAVEATCAPSTEVIQ